jgi:23S rRNA (cytosine1962-C5)-methyltransferase
MEIAKDWKDYELIDAGDGEKLERWGTYLLRRPDPQAVWNKNPDLDKKWNEVSAMYHRSETGGGSWEGKDKLPESWIINYKDLKLIVKPTGFKHTGLFPEQAPNWDFLIDLIKKHSAKMNRQVNVLNLFAYTGAATVACLYAGAKVCHIDSSAQILQTARENIKSSNLDESSARFIAEDVGSFVRREIRRGNKYDIIIMDPPTFGRGNKGQVWKIEKDLNPLVNICLDIMNDESFGFVVNTYVSGMSSQALDNILKLTIQKKFGGKIESGELGIPVTNSELILPAGSYARWFK